MFFQIELNFAQFIGGLSFIIGVITFCQKDDKKFKCYMLLLFFCQTAHYFLLGAQTSAVSSLINFLRTLVATKINSFYVALFFVMLNVLFGIFYTVNNASTVSVFFPIIAASIGTLALFCLQGIQMRLALLVGSVLWLCNNIIVGSIGGIMLETMVILINISTMIRLRRDNGKKAMN